MALTAIVGVALTACSHPGSRSGAHFCAVAHKIQTENAPTLPHADPALSRQRYLNQYHRLAAAAPSSVARALPATGRTTQADTARLQAALHTCGLTIDIFGQSVAPTPMK
jgi:hypothetical protein